MVAVSLTLLNIYIYIYMTYILLYIAYHPAHLDHPASRSDLGQSPKKSQEPRSPRLWTWLDTSFEFFWSGSPGPFFTAWQRLGTQQLVLEQKVYKRVYAVLTCSKKCLYAHISMTLLCRNILLFRPRFKSGHPI